MERVMILGIMLVLAVALHGAMLAFLILRRGPRIFDERPLGVFLFSTYAVLTFLVGLFFAEGVLSFIAFGTAFFAVLAIAYILLGPTTLLVSNVSDQIISDLIMSLLERRGLERTREGNTIRLLDDPLSIKVNASLFSTRVRFYTRPETRKLGGMIAGDLVAAVEGMDGAVNPAVA